MTKRNNEKVDTQRSYGIEKETIRMRNDKNIYLTGLRHWLVQLLVNALYAAPPNVTLLNLDFGEGKVFVFGSRGMRKKCLQHNRFFLQNRDILPPYTPLLLQIAKRNLGFAFDLTACSDRHQSRIYQCREILHW